MLRLFVVGCLTSQQHASVSQGRTRVERRVVEEMQKAVLVCMFVCWLLHVQANC